jgi:hypothetical protein
MQTALALLTNDAWSLLFSKLEFEPSSAYVFEGTVCPSLATLRLPVGQVRVWKDEKFENTTKAAFIWENRQIECPLIAKVPVFQDDFPAEGDIILLLGLARPWDKQGEFHPKRCYLQLNGVHCDG